MAVYAGHAGITDAPPSRMGGAGYTAIGLGLLAVIILYFSLRRS